jgi:hypothetical protein
MYRFLLILALVSYSPIVSAAVTINEVAWMGGTASANHEWIELYNSGESVSVDGWRLSDGMNLNINLTGIIPANSYAVLERSTDDSAPGVTAFIIYTGALVNTGATLTLRDSVGGIVDQVSGGENWQNIGGDNVTKETAQYTTRGWVTDAPTPGRVNGPGRVVEAGGSATTTSGGSTNTTTSSSNKSSGNKTVLTGISESVRWSRENPDLEIIPEIQTIGYVNQKIPLSVRIKNMSPETLRRVILEWNFGDSFTATGNNIEHVYNYPGNYVITVRAKHERSEEVVMHKLTILPVNFTLTISDDGDIQINNNSPYDVDLSGYKLRAAKTVWLPERTVLAAYGTITIAHERLVTNNLELIALYDASGEMVALRGGSGVGAAAIGAETIVSAPMAASAPLTSYSGAPSPRPVTPNPNFGFVPLVATAEASEPAPVKSIEAPKDEVIYITGGYKEDEGGSNTLAYLGLGGLLMLVLGLVFWRPRTKASEDATNLPW